MRRKTLDLLLNWVGVLLTVMLIVAGVGLLIGYNFTNSQVKSQLLEQKVYFPVKGGQDYQDLVAAHETSYAGKEVLTGSEAQIFANDIIGVDTNAISGGKTYAQVSAASLADPSNTALANEVNLVFRGDTLRGLLLNAYAFGFLGIVALWAAIASFALALVMLVLTLLGVRHYRKGDPADVI
ncbi:MAG: hypothetical protein WAN30_06755 [Acidimicrobiales bacterium]